MSCRGVQRFGSGRKRIYASVSEGVKFWLKKGHRRIWLDYHFYISWVSVKISGGYGSDSVIPGHLLSLERRRQVPFVYPFHVHFLLHLYRLSGHLTCFLSFASQIKESKSVEKKTRREKINKERWPQAPC